MILIYLDLFYITSLSHFGMILFYYSSVNIVYINIKKELETEHKNAYMFTTYLVNLPLTNLFCRSYHFYKIRA